MAKDRRRKLSDEEVALIAQAVIRKQQERCRNCSEEGEERHRHHHAVMDSLCDFIDKLSRAPWKMFYAGVSVISILAVGSLFVFFLYKLGVDIRKWKP